MVLAILPLSLLTRAFVGFMMATMFMSTRQGDPMWESSTLAILPHGLNEGRCQTFMAVRLSKMEVVLMELQDHDSRHNM